MALKIAQGLASTVILNDGVVMPLFGLGTYRMSSGKGAEAETLTSFALKQGYRLLDTAAFYENEADIGRGIKLSGIPRDQVFVVTKVFTKAHGYDKCKQAIEDSLKKLDTGYIDLYLIHAPTGGKVLETYDAILDAQKAGLIKSVGVSNFGIAQLEGLRLAGKPLPSVNQFELHPMHQEVELVKYCRDNNIAVMGYSPLAKARRMDETTLNGIAERYSKSLAQLMIRWSVQKGFITIPKSSKEERILENTQVFDWSISEEDMQTMAELDDFKCAWDPAKAKWEDVK